MSKMMVFTRGGKLFSLLVSYLYVYFSESGMVHCTNEGEIPEHTKLSTWVSVTLANCTIKKEFGDAPLISDQGCEATHKAGAIAWSLQRFQQETNDWLMFCIGDKWTALVGNNKSTFAKAVHKWALDQLDKGLQEAGTNHWQGEHVKNNEMDSICDDIPPIGYGNDVCSKHEDSDTPACTFDFIGTTFNEKVLLSGSSGSTIHQTQEETDKETIHSNAIDLAPIAKWASATVSNCIIKEEQGDPPKVGDTGCEDTYEAGAVAWSMSRFQQDENDWLMYCIGNKWTASFGKNMSGFASDGHKWAFAQVDTYVIQSYNSPWLKGEHMGQGVLDLRCADMPPTGWVNGGALVICTEALKNGKFVAAMCNKGDEFDVPACATDFSETALNGNSISSMSTVCPMKRMERF